MSWKYSYSAEEDDFFRALDKSLTVEYSSQKMSHFLSDLLVAINNLDNDPEEAFVFYDQESDDSSVSKFFTFPSSESDTFAVPSQRYLRKAKVNSKRRAHEISFDMFDDVLPQKLPRNNPVNARRKPVDINVDIFDDEPLWKNEVMKVSENDAIDDLPQKPESRTSSQTKVADESVDMFAEFQDDVESVDSASHCSDQTVVNAHSDVADSQNEETKNSELVANFEMAEQQAPDASITDQISKAPSMKADTHTNPHQQNIKSDRARTVEKMESDALGQGVDISICVPLNISNCEPNENEKTFSVELETSQLTCQPNKVNSSQKIENLVSHGIPFPIHTTRASANLSLQSSVFLGFSTPSITPSECGSDIASTICEEYFISQNFVPTLRRSSSECSSFIGFPHIDPITPIRHSASQPNPRNTSRTGSSPNTTFCEDFETARRMALEASLMNFNYEEAYSQCFLECENRAR